MERLAQPDRSARQMGLGGGIPGQRGARIHGGYYLKARCIADSAVAHAPPHVREIWDYFLRKALFKDGTWLKRGEVGTSYAEIQNDLSWCVGWRKEQYSKSKCESAMKWLKKADMITTRRTTHGLIVTVCNYDKYQAPGNYESHEADHRQTAGSPRPPDTTEKNAKELKKEESPSEGDQAHLILIGSTQLRAMTYEQDLRVRQDFKATLRPLDWIALARQTVSEAELMTEPIRNPALFWRKQIQKHVNVEFAAKTRAAPAGNEDSQEKLRSAFIM